METVNSRMSGWIAFAAVLLILVSVWNIIYGFALILKDDWVVFTEDGAVFFNTATWGWILLLTGILKFFTGYGLLARRQWARIVAIALVMITMFEQITLIGAYPWWSVVTIIISMFILHALIVPSADEHAYQ